MDWIALPRGAGVRTVDDQEHGIGEVDVTVAPRCW
jgi:hypothetical protein